MHFNNLKIKDGEGIKACNSDDYNYIFNKSTGLFVRWGENKQDDPKYAPFPEILDIEISTVCNGLGKPCSWCYKANTHVGTNMTLETFKEVVSKINYCNGLTQVALGIGDIDANKDMYDIMQYCRDIGIIPNLTINGYKLDDYHAKKLSELAGAVAVSHYGNDDICFNAIKKLTDLGMDQVNIHKLLAKETYKSCFDLVDKVKLDKRLEKLNAIVFLLLKPKGSRNKFHSVEEVDDYRKLIDCCFEKKVDFGFDSCSAGKFLKAIEGRENEKQLKMMAEPCESGLFSFYCDVNGVAYPCSFMEGEGRWEKGINLLEIDDFKGEVWYNNKLIEWRENLLDKNKKGCFDCPYYDI